MREAYPELFGCVGFYREPDYSERDQTGRRAQYLRVAAPEVGGEPGKQVDTGEVVWKERYIEITLDVSEDMVAHLVVKVDHVGVEYDVRDVLFVSSIQVKGDSAFSYVDDIELIVV